MSKRGVAKSSGMGPAYKIAVLKELLAHCLDQFSDGSIEGICLQVDDGTIPMNEIKLGSLADA